MYVYVKLIVGECDTRIEGQGGNRLIRFKVQ